MHDAIMNTLNKHFKGKNKEERLEAATRDVVTTVNLILSASKPKLKGATVMTEKASQTTLSGEYTQAPEQL